MDPSDLPSARHPSGDEIARLVRLRRLEVCRLGWEQWCLALAYCETKPDVYKKTEWRGLPAVVAGVALFIQGR